LPERDCDFSLFGIELLKVLGVGPPTRLVTGVARAKLAYVPPSTRCGNANPRELQILSRLYREYIGRSFPAKPRNRLIFIRRTNKRLLKGQQQIEKMVEVAARDFNLTYTLYADNPPPSLMDTMAMFHSAVMVVAPHGAGLSNLVFSEPGTYVVEAVCNPPHVNLCYRKSSVILGHHWHGLLSTGGCQLVVDVKPPRIDHAVSNTSDCG
jgi:hypothetical protein